MVVVVVVVVVGVDCGVIHHVLRSVPLVVST